ncbi:MAG: dCMP deaminase family protein [Flavobacteriales bacterium]|nr:dCMP deaminase family protein [Flavobacteriales bacterium]
MSEEKQRRYDQAYLRMAGEWAKLSHCTRKQVGALIVRDGMIVADGFNGTPSGFPNACETPEGETHWYVLHAEANAITKLARSSHGSQGATLYITMSPCRDCSKLILQSGIIRVVYQSAYKDREGLEFLEKAGVALHYLPLDL